MVLARGLAIVVLVGTGLAGTALLGAAPAHAESAPAQPQATTGPKVTGATGGEELQGAPLPEPVADTDPADVPEPADIADPGTTDPQPGDTTEPTAGPTDKPTEKPTVAPDDTDTGQATDEPPTSPTEQTPTASPESSQPTQTATPSDTATADSASPTQSPSPSESSPEPTPTVTVTQRPATPPAAADSNIPIGMVFVAALVLISAVLAAVAIARRGRSAAPSGPPSGPPSVPPSVPPSGPWVGADDTMVLPRVPDMRSGPAGAPTEVWSPPAKTPADNTELMSFLTELGGAMIDSGDPVTHINNSLALVAGENGEPDAEVVVMATALFVSVPGEQMSTAVAAAGENPLRLDQIDAVFEVVHAAERGDVRPAEGRRLLAEARAMPPTFSPAAQVVGYVVFTLGLSLIMQSSVTEIALAVVLGAAVGLFEQWAGRFAQPFRVFLPVVSAFGVSLAVFLAGRIGMDVSGFTSLIAPLVAFIPGALLTTGVIELATGQIVSGSGRLAAGAMRLVLLALGILAAGQLVGVPATNVTAVAPNPLGSLSPWVGVAVFGAGIVVNRCARPAALPWIVMILYVAYAGQVVGGLFLGASLAAFCGALAMTPFAMFVASQKSGPTTLVSFLPGYWILVPGSVGLVGVTNLLGEQRDLGLATLMSAGATMVSISLGVLLGLAVAALLRWPVRSAPAPGQPPADDWTGTLIGLPPVR